MKVLTLFGRPVCLASIFILINAFNHPSFGAAGDVDLSFDPGSSVTNPVSVVVMQPDGKVLIGGALTFINGTNHYASARLKDDGSWDSTFISDSFTPDLTNLYGGPPSYAGIAALVVQSDARVIVGGYVTLACPDGAEECQTSYANFVTRLNPDGSRDASFTPLFGEYALAVQQMPQVRTLALQPDGKVLVGYDGYGVVRGIIRLNSNGIRDPNFNTSVDYPGVYSIVPQADGKLLMGGSFNTVNGTNRNGLARLNSDGSLDDTFIPVLGGYPLALQPDGKVLVGGYARLESDGSLDSSFNQVTGVNGSVRSIALQADGRVIISGGFTTVNGVSRPYVARLHGHPVPPSLNLVRSNAVVVASWSVTALNFQLQETTNLALPDSWTPVGMPAFTNAGQITLSLPISVGDRFFRLESQ